MRRGLAVGCQGALMPVALTWTEKVGAGYSGHGRELGRSNA